MSKFTFLSILMFTYYSIISSQSILLSSKVTNQICDIRKCILFKLDTEVVLFVDKETKLFNLDKINSKLFTNGGTASIVNVEKVR